MLGMLGNIVEHKFIQFIVYTNTFCRSHFSYRINIIIRSGRLCYFNKFTHIINN